MCAYGVGMEVPESNGDPRSADIMVNNVHSSGKDDCVRYVF